MDKEKGTLAACENIHSDRPMSSTQAAYFAGMVDGEGSITIVRSKNPARRTGWRYQHEMSVAGSDLAHLMSLRQDCGNGWIKSNYHKKLKSYHRTVYQLRFTPNQLRHLLPQLLPYLRLKSKQAQLLLRYLAFTKKSDGGTRPDEYWQQIEAWRVEIQNMNPRGPSPFQKPDVLNVRESRQGINQFTKTSESA